MPPRSKLRARIDDSGQLMPPRINEPHLVVNPRRAAVPEIKLAAGGLLHRVGGKACDYFIVVTQVDQSGTFLQCISWMSESLVITPGLYRGRQVVHARVAALTTTMMLVLRV